MKNPPEVCAKCSAREISIGPITSYSHDLVVSTYQDPTAVLFKGEKSAKLVAAVCLACGYVELYVDYPGELAQPPA